MRRYASQTELYDAPGWLIWTYRTRTTVNCLITDMMAKSNSPFDFFVTTTGQTVEMSPFYDGKNTETFHERADSFHVRTNYKIVDYDNRGTNPQGERRAFLDKGTYTLSWKLENRTAYCPLQHWQTFDSTIATETGKSIHFVTDEGTSSFVTNTTVGIELPDAFKCIEEQVNKTMHEKYEAVQDRYTKGQEAITYFITSGGLLLAWLPLTPRSLATVKNLTELTTPTSSPPSNEEKFSVESYETDQMDTIYQCYNAVKMTKDGLTRVYVDRDGVNITVNLKPTGGLANGVRRYASQTELYDAPGWLSLNTINRPSV